MLCSNLKIGQIFKNYRELCVFLGESVKNGDSKVAQLKEWQRYFSWEKQGYKLIITEVFDEPKEKEDNRGGNNQKNIKYMMEWIMQCFTEEHMNKSYPISYWTSDVLGLLNKNIANMPYNDIETDEYYSPVDIYCKENYILDRDLFLDYVSAVKFQTKKLFTTALSCLQRKDLIEYEDNYSFCYEGLLRKSIVHSDEFNDLILNMETEICEEMTSLYFPNSKIKGKQLLYILSSRNNKGLRESYNKQCIDTLNQNNEFLSNLNHAIEDQDVVNHYTYLDGENQRLLSYFKSYAIVMFDEKYVSEIEDAKQKTIEVIQRLALKQVKSIKRTSYGEIYYPYNNEWALGDIEKINISLFFQDNPTKLEMPKNTETNKNGTETAKIFQFPDSFINDFQDDELNALFLEAL